MEIIDGKHYNRQAATKDERFVTFKIWMSLTNYLFEHELAAQLFPCVVAVADCEMLPAVFVGLVANKKEKVFTGVPELIVELTNTPEKFVKYRALGVPEYWLIDYQNKEITTNVLVDQDYVTTSYAPGDVLPVAVLPDLKFDVTKIFTEVTE